MILRSRILHHAMIATTLVVAAPLFTAVSATADTTLDLSDSMSRETATGWGVAEAGTAYAVTPEAAGSVTGGAAKSSRWDRGEVHVHSLMEFRRSTCPFRRS